MEKEIEEIIKKNLPAQVGEVLKTRLEQAERDANTVKSQSEQIVSKTATILGLEKTISDYKQFDNRNSALEAREKAVAEKERNQKVFEAELKLAEAEKRTADATNFVGMVFKSPIYRKTTFENENGMQSWNSQTNRNEFVPSGGKSKTEEKTID